MNVCCLLGILSFDGKFLWLEGTRSMGFHGGIPDWTVNCISSHFQSFGLRTSSKMNSGGVSDQAVQHFTLLTSKMHPYNRSFKSKQCSNVTGVIPNVCIFDMKNRHAKSISWSIWTLFKPWSNLPPTTLVFHGLQIIHLKAGILKAYDE